MFDQVKAMKMTKMLAAIALPALLFAAPVLAQSAPSAAPPAATQNIPAASAPITPPPGYVIGAGDVLTVMYYGDKEMTSEVTVRPDGKVTIQLINDVVAAGLTPDALRVRITEESKRLFENPSVSVVVKQINSRKIYVTGEVAKQGPQALLEPMTIVQALTNAGGLSEFAKSKNILIIRLGQDVPIKFNYNDFKNAKNLKQNIYLEPGDQIVVP